MSRAIFAAGLPGSLLVALLVACSSNPGTPDARLSVVTTVSPITNIAQNVAGDRAAITGLIPEGTNSHTFEPAPSDARVLAQADVVFVNGLHLEQPSVALARANLRRGTEIVELGPLTVTPAQQIFDFSFPRAKGDPNPHLWTNPPYALRYSEIIRDTLSRRDPAGKDVYTRNQAAFATKVRTLDHALRAATATVPAERRKLLTYHDSFAYFAREYGWTVVGAIQPSDFADPTAREVARLIEQVRREHVPAIFGSEVFPSPVLAQIAREARAAYVSDLRDDDLPGKKGEPQHSLLGLLAFDYRTIVTALGGDASAFDGLDTANVATDSATTYRY